MHHMTPFRSTQKLAVCYINEVWHTMDRGMCPMHVHVHVNLLHFHLYTHTPHHRYTIICIAKLPHQLCISSSKVNANGQYHLESIGVIVIPYACYLCKTLICNNRVCVMHSCYCYPEILSLISTIPRFT